MIIVWSGAGIVVPLMAFITLFATELVTDSVFGDGFFLAHGIPKLLGFWVAAGLTWVLALALAKQKGTPYYNARTDQLVMVKKRHSLFFIPVAYWTYILLAVGVLFLFI